MPTPPYSPSRIEISIPTRSSDGLYWGRYPNGDKPGGLAGPASVVTSATAALTTHPATLAGAAQAVVNASGTLTGGSGTNVKWPAGHHTESDSILFQGDTISRVQAEMDLGMTGLDNILGYMALVTWANIEPSQNVFNWVTLDAIFNRLKTQYSKPKYFWVCLEWGAFNSSSAGTSTAIIPGYIQTNTALYGNSPIAGRSGWWGTTNNGNLYAACVYRTNVGNAFINMATAVMNRYKNDPMFAGIYIVETSTVVGAATAGPTTAGDYSDAAFSAFILKLVDACVAAAPTCNIVVSNSFLFTIGPTQQLTVDLINHRAILGQTDTLGVAITHHSWGQGTYVGSYAPTFPDMRSTNSIACEVQATDMGFFGQFSYAPSDILNAMNTRDKNAISFWCIMFTSTSGTRTPAAWWTNLGPYLNNPVNKLTNTGRPVAY